MSLSREIPLVFKESALLLIDMQNFSCHRQGNEFQHLSQQEFNEKYTYFFDQLKTTVIPNIQNLQQAFRTRNMEVLYTTIESLTLDGRDRSLDYKISGFHVPKGSWDAQVIEELAIQGDEICLPKSSSSVFISTHIDYILRNLGIKQLVVCGCLTDQCVESAIRDACDLGYLVTQITDACATYSPDRHHHSLQAIQGYCRQRTTQELLTEFLTANVDRKI